MTTPEQVLAALEARQPQVMRPDLSRIRDLMDALGSPQLTYPSVHLTGTNGKTSTARMVDSLLRALGVRTGRYTSPHLQRVNERISVDGAPLTDEQLVQAFTDVIQIAEFVDTRHDQPLSYFELVTAMALAFFADAPVDAAVIEVGLGGEWDATNVIDAPVSVVLPVSLDHTELLGTTLTEIATEKAGIMRPGATVVLAEQPLEAAEALLRKAVSVEATVARAGLEFGLESRAVAVGGQLLTLRGLHATYDDVFLPLHGQHQADNAAVALAAVEAFVGGVALEADAVREGFASADSPGRLEIVRRAPVTLVDGAHNPAGAEATAQALADSFSFQRVVGVLAVLGDKDVDGVLQAFEPAFDHVVCTTNSSPRALPADELGRRAAEVFGRDRVTVAASLPDAIDEAYRLVEAEADLGAGGVVITGSIVTVGDARALLTR